RGKQAVGRVRAGRGSGQAGSGFTAGSGAGPDTESLKGRYTAWINRQDALQREKVELAGLDPGVFQIVDPPAEPKSPSGPNRSKLLMVALGISIVVGLIVVGSVEAPRLASVRDIPDVEYY